MHGLTGSYSSMMRSHQVIVHVSLMVNMVLVASAHYTIDPHGAVTKPAVHSESARNQEEQRKAGMMRREPVKHEVLADSQEAGDNLPKMSQIEIKGPGSQILTHAPERLTRSSSTIRGGMKRNPHEEQERIKALQHQAHEAHLALLQQKESLQKPHHQAEGERRVEAEASAASDTQHPEDIEDVEDVDDGMPEATESAPANTAKDATASEPTDASPKAETTDDGHKSGDSQEPESKAPFTYTLSSGSAAAMQEKDAAEDAAEDDDEEEVSSQSGAHDEEDESYYKLFPEEKHQTKKQISENLKASPKLAKESQRKIDDIWQRKAAKKMTEDKVFQIKVPMGAGKQLCLTEDKKNHRVDASACRIVGNQQWYWMGNRLANKLWKGRCLGYKGSHKHKEELLKKAHEKHATHKKPKARHMNGDPALYDKASLIEAESQLSEVQASLIEAELQDHHLTMPSCSDVSLAVEWEIDKQGRLRSVFNNHCMAINENNGYDAVVLPCDVNDLDQSLIDETNRVVPTPYPKRYQ